MPAKRAAIDLMPGHWAPQIAQPIQLNSVARKESQAQLMKPEGSGGGAAWGAVLPLGHHRSKSARRHVIQSSTRSLHPVSVEFAPSSAAAGLRPPSSTILMWGALPIPPATKR